MAKKKSALFMTVGLGGKTQDKIDSLAHGMLDTILEGNFDYVVLFGSEGSKSTLESLKKQYIQKFNENPDSEDLDEFDYYEFVQEDNVNDFNDYYDAIRTKILELQDEYNIKINYTPGTKTMSISAAIASLVFRKKLRLIDGDRGDGTTVQSGTERHVDFSLYKVYDEVLVRRIKEAFNNNQFYFGKLLADDLTDEEIRQNFYTLLNIYSNWDKIDFKKAQSYFEDGFIPKFPEISEKLSDNVKSLRFINPIPIKEKGVITGYRHDRNCKYYKLASIINNAERRFDERKYDDAIARLYRCFEYIGQIKLEEYGISTDNVDTDILYELGIDETFINELKAKANDDGKIKSSLDQDFEILAKLDDIIGKKYMKKKDKIRGLLSARNYSILAHGFEIKTKEEYNNLKKEVLSFAKLLHDEMDMFISETEFPKFDI